MSNGSSVLDESASVLFVYAAPENEHQRSKVLFEELCRSFDGNDMQGKYDQMLLFEKLREGLFDDMILIGLCMHAKEQLKDVMEVRKLQQAKLELYRTYREKNEQRALQEL
jgi:hypothetical protein